MFLAAFTSRSWTTPHRHAHSRTSSGIVDAITPHTEQVFDDGQNRSITTTRRPYQSALYSSIDRNSDQLASEITRDNDRFFTMFRTLRSSMAIT